MWLEQLQDKKNDKTLKNSIKQIRYIQAKTIILEIQKIN